MTTHLQALKAIAGMTTNDTTNHTHLAALCIAVARAALDQNRDPEAYLTARGYTIR